MQLGNRITLVFDAEIERCVNSVFGIFHLVWIGLLEQVEQYEVRYSCFQRRVTGKVARIDRFKIGNHLHVCPVSVGTHIACFHDPSRYFVFSERSEFVNAAFFRCKFIVEPAGEGLFFDYDLIEIAVRRTAAVIIVGVLACRYVQGQCREVRQSFYWIRRCASRAVMHEVDAHFQPFVFVDAAAEMACDD